MDSTAATSLLLNLLQISDSAFPTGSFAHSGGFEAAGQRGFIDSADKVEQFLVASLENVGCHVRSSVWLPGHTGDPSRDLLSFRHSSDDGRQCSAAGHNRNARGTTNSVQTASTDPRHCGKEQGEDTLHCL